MSTRRRDDEHQPAHGREHGSARIGFCCPVSLRHLPSRVGPSGKRQSFPGASKPLTHCLEQHKKDLSRAYVERKSTNLKILDARWWGALLSVAGIFAAAYSLTTAIQQDGPKPVEFDGFNAQLACEELVRKQLKAPATAQFAPNGDLRVSDDGYGRWTVDGYVDASNSFGAHLRNRYRCSLEFDGTETKGSAAVF